MPTQTGGVIIPIPAKATKTTYKWSKLWSKDNVNAANIGTVMIVTERIFIEKDARIAQMYFHENKEGELYDGQFQNDKQRK